MEDVMVDLQLRVPCADLGALVAQLTGLGHEVKVVVSPRALSPAPIAVRERPAALPAPTTRKELAAPKVDRPTHCQLRSCGKKLHGSGMGRAKRFCGASCRNAAKAADDEEHGAPTLKPPALPTWRPRAAEVERLPERPPQHVQAAGAGHDPLAAVVEASADADELLRRAAASDQLKRSVNAAPPPSQGAAPLPGSRLMSRYAEQRGR